MRADVVDSRRSKEEAGSPLTAGSGLFIPEAVGEENDYTAK
jgi:hypothetical protein